MSLLHYALPPTNPNPVYTNKQKLPTGMLNQTLDSEPKH